MRNFFYLNNVDKPIELRNYRWKRKFEEIYESIKNLNLKDIKILDIGSSDGLLLSLLDKKLNFKKAVGIDIVIPEAKYKNIKLVKGNAESLPFKDKGFNLIISSSVMQYITNKNKMLRECYRVLENRGFLIITSPNPIHNIFAHKVCYIKKWGKGETEYSHSKNIDLKDLHKLLEENNFRIISEKRFLFFSIRKFLYNKLVIWIEKKLESLFRLLRLDFLMANQIIVAYKK